MAELDFQHQIGHSVAVEIVCATDWDYFEAEWSGEGEEITLLVMNGGYGGRSVVAILQVGSTWEGLGFVDELNCITYTRES